MKKLDLMSPNYPKFNWSFSGSMNNSVKFLLQSLKTLHRVPCMKKWGSESPAACRCINMHCRGSELGKCGLGSGPGCSLRCGSRSFFSLWCESAALAYRPPGLQGEQSGLHSDAVRIRLFTLIRIRIFSLKRIRTRVTLSAKTGEQDFSMEVLFLSTHSSTLRCTKSIQRKARLTAYETWAAR